VWFVCSGPALGRPVVVGAGRNQRVHDAAWILASSELHRDIGIGEHGVVLGRVRSHGK
jgi:hypothetical protein